MSAPATPSFGIKTAPADVDYWALRQVWLDADGIPEIEHVWLYDHLLPNHRGRVGDPTGPIYESWTLLAVLAAELSRLRLGVMVTNNRIRRPAVLAKMAATIDVVSDGRLDVGIGVGGLPDRSMVAAEYEAYDIPLRPWNEAVEDLAEACTIIRRLWTEDGFDFDGRHHRLRNAHGYPKPLQRPHPPILVAGSGPSTLPIVAEHADIWNTIGPPTADIDQLVERSAALDRCCEAIGRDPRTVVRSVQVPVAYDDADRTRSALVDLVGAGFTHVVLNLAAPYPDGVARWVVDALIEPTLARVPGHDQASVDPQ